MIHHSRRTFLQTLASSTVALALPAAWAVSVAAPETARKRHLVTLSFDDGFRDSFVRVAEIYEKRGLSACLNVLAAGFPNDPDGYVVDAELGDFSLWNELQRRGHEIMPHGYQHENLKARPLDEAKELVERCLAVFSEKLEGFNSNRAVFNFPYNASTPQLEQWLPSRVRAFRTGGGVVNSFPRAGMSKITCSSAGPGNCEPVIDQELERFLAMGTGWFVFNTHGLDGEGWGPIRASYLERLLDRLMAIDTVEILPAGRALEKYAS